jgi:hypothetical protein
MFYDVWLTSYGTMNGIKVSIINAHLCMNFAIRIGKVHVSKASRHLEEFLKKQMSKK